MSHPGRIVDQLRQSTSILLEAVQFQLAELRRSGSDEIQKLVSECEEAVAEISGELDSIATVEKHKP
jgi:hypothetical protein